MRDSGTYAQIDDTGLWALMRQDDPVAFEELYRRYSSKIYLFVLFYLKDWSLADDILQDIFVALWERRRSLVIPASVKGYLYTSAKNHVLNQIRSHNVCRDYLKTVMSEDRGTRILTPEEIYERDEMNRLLDLAISDLRLGGKKRQIVELRRSGMSSKEVAGRLGISENTVRMYYSQSIRTLRDYLKKLY